MLAVLADQAVLEPQMHRVIRAVQRALVVQLDLGSACLVDGAALEERAVVVGLAAYSVGQAATS